MPTPWCSEPAPGNSEAVAPRIGVGLRQGVPPRLLASSAGVLDCVEIDAEWYFAGERPNFVFRETGAQEFKRFDDSLDLGVRTLALSLGSPGPLDSHYVDILKRLADETRPAWISGQIGISRVGPIDLGSRIPVAPSHDSIELLAEHVIALSETLGTPVLIENLFSHLRLKGTLNETEFINRLCESANCGFLLDIDILQSLSAGWGFDPIGWIGDIEPQHLTQLRLQMPSVPVDGGGTPWDTRRERLLIQAVRHAPIDRIILEQGAGGTDIARLTDDVGRLRTLVEQARSPAEILCQGQEYAATIAEPAEPRKLPASGEYPIIASSSRDNARPGIRLLPGVDLLFLGDGGRLFSQPHQELHELNGGAAFIWCCLEQGLTSSEIVARYRETFGADSCDVGTLVFELLESWQALGVLAPVPVRSPITTHLSTAIAYLLRNPILRELFRESQIDVARLLNVAPHQLDTFLSIDPDELEQQALLVEQERRWIRSPDYPKQPAARSRSADMHERHACRPSQAIEHRYRLLNTVFQVEFQTPDEFQQVHPAIHHLSIASHYEPDVILRLTVEGSATIVEEDGLSRDVCADAARLVPLVVSRFRRIATGRHRFLAKIHAGVVSNGTACAVFPAQAGSGKTTLVAALVASGFHYFSDEYALLENETLNVSPVPFAMTVKDGSINVLSPHYPELRRLPVHLRIDNKRVRYLLPPPEKCAIRMDQSVPVRWVVFPRYDSDAETRLIPVPQIAALRRLLDQCLVLPEDLDWHKVQRLIHWFRNVECYELPFSSLGGAVALIQREMGTP